MTTSGQKWIQKSKSKRNGVELRFFHQSICLDELIILAELFVKIGCKMTELRSSKNWPQVAMRLFLDHFLAMLAVIFEIHTSNLPITYMKNDGQTKF